MIELRVAISPTPAFLNRVLLIAASLRQFHPDSIVRAYIGDPDGARPETIQLVDQTFCGHRIGFEWISQREMDEWAGSRAPYLATMNRRWRTPIDGDHVIIADADVVICGPLDDLFKNNAVQGVMAHVAPLSDDNWRYLFAIAGCRPPLFAYPYSGNGIMGPAGKLAMFYPNSGFFFAPRALFERMIEPYNVTIRVLKGAMRDYYWFDQLALAIAAAKSEVPVRALPLAYNFPNQVGFEEAHPAELDHAKVIHFLRTDTIDRDRDFESVPAMKRLVARTDLTGSNEMVRKRVEELLPIVFPSRHWDGEERNWA